MAGIGFYLDRRDNLLLEDVFRNFFETCKSYFEFERNVPLSLLFFKYQKLPPDGIDDFDGDYPKKYRLGCPRSSLVPLPDHVGTVAVIIREILLYWVLLQANNC